MQDSTEPSLREFTASIPANLPSPKTLDHTFNFLSNVPCFSDLDQGASGASEKIELQPKQSAIFICGNWYDPRKTPVLLAKRQYELARGVKRVPLFIGGAQGRLTSAQQQKFGGEHLAHKRALIANGVPENEIIIISQVPDTQHTGHIADDLVSALLNAGGKIGEERSKEQTSCEFARELKKRLHITCYRGMLSITTSALHAYWSIKTSKVSAY